MPDTGIIQRLMDEESEVAEDTTQNALLPKASVPSVPEGDIQIGEPQLEEMAPEMAVEAPGGSQDDTQPIDESNHIPVPEGVLEGVRPPDGGVENSQEMIPQAQWGEGGVEKVGEITVGDSGIRADTKPDPSWDEAFAAMAEESVKTFDSIEIRSPRESGWEEEMNWNSALLERGDL